jgi:hypothetical protein
MDLKGEAKASPPFVALIHAAAHLITSFLSANASSAKPLQHEIALFSGLNVLCVLSVNTSSANPLQRIRSLREHGFQFMHHRFQLHNDPL